MRQSIDCLSNCLNHKRFLSALYPDGRAEQLVQVIDFLSLHLASSFNIIITELFIEFFEENIRLYLKGQCDVLLIPSVIREKISHLLSLRIFSLYNNPKAHNNQLLKLRLLTLL